ncbi:CCA tRNA nucleotidyltransferase, partial [Akkermansiaceae bacterium]|nr:CCA tRNA nucleotidyltransferase [Akkermansiaceae bacterium]
PLLTGKDLIERGLKPGPEFKALLSNLQTEQLEGTISTREDALKWLDLRS